MRRDAMPEPCAIRRAALRLIVGAAVGALAACGRKGAPQPPLDVDPCYPRHYPMDEGAKALCAQKEIYAREHPPQPAPPKRGQRQRERAPAPAAQPPAAQPAPASPPAEQPPASTPAPAQPPQPESQ